MKRYWRIFRQEFAISISTMLTYRQNVVLFLIFESFFVASGFISFGVGFSFANGDIAGWTRDQAFFLTAVNSLSHQLFITFMIAPILSLPFNVWNGKMDYILLKPLHPLASIFFNAEFVVSNLPNIAVNLALTVYFAAKTPFTFSFAHVVLLVVMVIVGFAVRAAIGILCVSPAFFAEKLIGVEDSFWTLVSIGRYPLSVFPRTLELFFTFALPVGIMSAVPVGVFFAKYSLPYAAATLTFATVFLVATVKIFRLALRSYQSVNSAV